MKKMVATSRISAKTKELFVPPIPSDEQAIKTTVITILRITNVDPNFFVMFGSTLNNFISHPPANAAIIAIDMVPISATST